MSWELNDEPLVDEGLEGLELLKRIPKNRLYSPKGSQAPKMVFRINPALKRLMREVVESRSNPELRTTSDLLRRGAFLAVEEALLTAKSPNKAMNDLLIYLKMMQNHDDFMAALAEGKDFSERVADSLRSVQRGSKEDQTIRMIISMAEAFAPTPIISEQLYKELDR